jgi:hypothetical protein
MGSGSRARSSIRDDSRKRRFAHSHTVPAAAARKDGMS